MPVSHREAQIRRGRGRKRKTQGLEHKSKLRFLRPIPNYSQEWKGGNKPYPSIDEYTNKTW